MSQINNKNKTDHAHDYNKRRRIEFEKESGLNTGSPIFGGMFGGFFGGLLSGLLPFLGGIHGTKVQHGGSIKAFAKLSSLKRKNNNLPQTDSAATSKTESDSDQSDSAPSGSGENNDNDPMTNITEDCGNSKSLDAATQDNNDSSQRVDDSVQEIYNVDTDLPENEIAPKSEDSKKKVSSL